VLEEEWSKRFLEAMMEIKDDVRRIEIKVSMMTRAVEYEPRGKEDMRSVAVKRSGRP